MVKLVDEIAKLYPYVQQTALKSPCTRRKYGVAIFAMDKRTGDIFDAIYAENARVTDCCNGNACVRDRLGIKHAQSVEKGAEVHAEQAALIKWNAASALDWIFVIAGYGGGLYPADRKNSQELTGVNLYPCYTCARMIAYAGFPKVYLKNAEGNIESVSIRRIIHERELEWGET